MHGDLDGFFEITSYCYDSTVIIMLCHAVRRIITVQLYVFISVPAFIIISPLCFLFYPLLLDSRLPTLVQPRLVHEWGNAVTSRVEQVVSKYPCILYKT